MLELGMKKRRHDERDYENLQEEYRNYAYAVAHDMSAPLRAIKGFLTLIQMKEKIDLDEETEKYFSFVMQGVEQGETILDSLLLFSRLDRCDEKSMSVNSNEIASEVLESLSAEIEKSNAQISIAKLPVIVAKPSSISKVFYHVIRNAILYKTPNETPIISIDCTENENDWIFSIKDNGMGMRDSMKDKIFTVLKRAVGNEYPGRGMGLAISRKILQQHYGTISVESELGKGSTFTFTISKHQDA